MRSIFVDGRDRDRVGSHGDDRQTAGASGGARRARGLGLATRARRRWSVGVSQAGTALARAFETNLACVSVCVVVAVPTVVYLSSLFRPVGA